jgi:hypothetical protein
VQLYHYSKELNVGRAGEHLVMFDLLMQGYQCYTTDQGVSYDIIVDLGSNLLRLQVKTTGTSKLLRQDYATKSYVFNVRRAGSGGARKYQVSEFDGFACVALDLKQVAYIPFINTINKSLILRDRRQNYCQHNGGNHAPYFDEFTFDKFLESFDVNFTTIPLKKQMQKESDFIQTALFELT